MGPIRRGKPYLGYVPYKVVPAAAPFDVTGAEFTSSLEAYFGADVSGASFSASLSATIIDTSFYVSGGSFAASLDASFGMGVTGGTFSASLSATLSEESYLFVTGGEFLATLSSTIQATEYIDVSGGSFRASLDASFGADVTGGSFTATLSAELSGPSTMYVSGGSFTAVLSAAIQDIGLFDVTGGAFIVEFPYFHVTGATFSAELSANITNAVNNSVAYVLNMRTGESTRYTNYDFDYIINVGDRQLGVTSSAQYWLEGTTDNGTAINGTITTKETDFGTYQSKRCEYSYLNSDTSTTITPIVDGVRKQSHTSAFGGRRTKMSLGNAGRYWRFEIANISKLEGAEFMPQSRQSRVK